MGRYINWADITNRYPDATKIGGAADVSSAWIFGAEADLDSRLGSKFTVPFSPVPDVIKDLCIDLAYYRMVMRQKGSEPIGKLVDTRIAGMLNGTIVVAGAPETSGSALAYVSNSYHSAFGPDSEVNWQVSTEWVQAAQEERGQL